MKILNSILSLLFILFAVVQLNDPDPLQWVFAYGLMAFLFGLAVFKKLNTKIVLPILGIFLAWSISFIPDFISWINLGTPSITSKMKTNEPHIELVREFLGLVICLVGLLYLLWFSKETRLAKS